MLYNIDMDKQLEILKTRDISKHGGPRKNSGRKPKLNYEAREYFNLAVDKMWPNILEKISEYVEKGDKDVIKMLIEQRIGRPIVPVSLKKIESHQNTYNLFYNPEVRKATQDFEEMMKDKIRLECVSGKEE